MRRFEFEDGSSQKFWEIEVTESAYMVRYGRIGAKGREQTKTFASEAEAQAAAEKQIKQKLRKGYVELTEATTTPSTSSDEASATPAPAASSSNAPPVEDPSAEAQPVEAAPAEAPKRIPASGRWHTLRPPAGGRAYLTLPHIRWWAGTGPYRLACTLDGAVYRVDLASAQHTLLAKLPIEKRSCALAIDDTGTHWAVAAYPQTFGEQGQTWLDGELLDEPVASITFGENGLLLGTVGQEVVKVDPETREVRWRGGRRSGQIVESAGWILQAHAFGADLLSPGGELTAHEIREEDQRVLGVVARDGLAVVFHQDEVVVWNLAEKTHQSFPVRVPSFVAYAEGRWVWPGGAFDPRTGEVERFDVAPLGSPNVISLGGARVAPTVSPDGTELWELFTGANCIRRLSLSTHEERGDVQRMEHAWDFAVDNAGRIALACDGGWMLWSASGEELARTDMEQSTAIAFSPDGDHIAVAEIGDRGAVLRIVRASDQQELARRKGDAMSLAFSPNGDRLVCCGEKSLIVDAATLEPQHALDRGLRNARWSGGRIVAHDYEGRVYVYDDPGPSPAVKRPKKLKAAVKLSRANAMTNTPSPRAAVFGDRVRVFSHEGMSDWDLASRKRIATDASIQNGHGAGSGLFVAKQFVAEQEGQVVFRRHEESEPFAHLPPEIAPVLPDLIAASPDGRQVAIMSHAGVFLWRGEGEKTAEGVAPTPPPPTWERLGFSDDTVGLLLHGVAVELQASAASAFCEALSQSPHGVVAVPAADLTESLPDYIAAIVIGVEVARAGADAEQGTPGEDIEVDAASLTASAKEWAAVQEAVCAHIDTVLDGKAEREDAALHLIATGPLASASLTARDGAKLRSDLGDETQVQVSWDAEATIPVEAIGAHFVLNATYD